MPTITVTLPANIAQLAAPVLLGYMLNWGLLGSLSIQVYLYHIAFPKDRWHTKLLVYVVYAIEMAQTIIVVHDAYTAYAKSFGDVEELNNIQNEWLAVPVFSAIVSCTVQIYYAYRIGLLSGSRVLRGIVSLVALTQGVAGLVDGAQAFMIGNFSDLTSRSFVATSIWLAGCAVCDVLIAICMAYYLSRNTGSIPQTQAIISRLVRLVIETGTLTAVMATVDLILFLTFSHSAYHACAALALSKLYSNSLLVLFNNRIKIVGSRNYTPDSSYLSYHRTDAQHAPSGSSSMPPIIFNPRDTAHSFNGIRVEEEIYVECDSIQLHSLNSESKPVDKKAPTL